MGSCKAVLTRWNIISTGINKHGPSTPPAKVQIITARTVRVSLVIGGGLNLLRESSFCQVLKNNRSAAPSTGVTKCSILRNRCWRLVCCDLDQRGLGEKVYDVMMMRSFLLFASAASTNPRVREQFPAEKSALALGPPSITRSLTPMTGPLPRSRFPAGLRASQNWNPK